MFRVEFQLIIVLLQGCLNVQKREIRQGFRTLCEMRVDGGMHNILHCIGIPQTFHYKVETWSHGNQAFNSCRSKAFILRLNPNS